MNPTYGRDAFGLPVIFFHAPDHDEMLRQIEARNETGAHPFVYTDEDVILAKIQATWAYAVGPSFDLEFFSGDYEQTSEAFERACDWCGEQFGGSAFTRSALFHAPDEVYFYCEIDAGASWAYDADEFVVYFRDPLHAVLYKTLQGF